MLANINRTLIVTSLLIVITLIALYSIFWADKEVNKISHAPDTITLQISKGTESPRELPDSFYPVQEPGSEITGPQTPPDMLIKELPMVNFIENDTGPVDPTISSEENREEFDLFPQ